MPDVALIDTTVDTSVDISVGNSVSDDHLVHRLRELEARRRELEAETVALLAELDERKAYRADGHATMWGLLRVLAAGPIANAGSGCGSHG